MNNQCEREEEEESNVASRCTRKNDKDHSFELESGTIRMARDM